MEPVRNHGHLSDRELLLLVLGNQAIIIEKEEQNMASTTALTAAVENLSVVVSEAVTAISGNEDQAAIDSATAAIETAITDLKGALPAKPVPTISSVVPTSGGVAGGEAVTVTGSGFTGATSVEFGPAAAESFIVVSDTEITAVTPAFTAGAVEISVSGPDGKATVGFTFA